LGGADDERHIESMRDPSTATAGGAPSCRSCP